MDTINYSFVLCVDFTSLPSIFQPEDLAKLVAVQVDVGTLNFGLDVRLFNAIRHLSLNLGVVVKLQDIQW